MVQTLRDGDTAGGPFAPFEQDEAFHDLRRLMASARPPIALIGAGASVNSGYVGWPDLLKALESAAGALGERWRSELDGFKDASWTAEVHRRSMGEARFFELISTLFCSKGTAPAEPHPLLARMPFRHYLTTNYDPCIEEALAAANRPAVSIDWSDETALSNFLIGMGDRSAAVAVVHLHGYHHAPAETVLTERSYVQRYIASDDARRKLLAIFLTNPVVFVGFSMTDPDFGNLMREVTARLRTESPAHYVILGYKTLQEREAYTARMVDKFGVRPVFFSRNVAGDEDDYANLIHLLDALAGHPHRGKIFAQARATECARPPIDKADPQKGQFGGVPEANGRRLLAEPGVYENGWLSLRLIVERTDGAPLTGTVRFHLHDTFPTPIHDVMAVDGRAEMTLASFGAFTVGAEADGGRTRLELDMALEETFPDEWRRN